MKGVHSLREITRLLNTDQRLRKLCLIRVGEAAKQLLPNKQWVISGLEMLFATNPQQ